MIVYLVFINYTVFRVGRITFLPYYSEFGLLDDPPKFKIQNPQNGLACVPPKNDPPLKISNMDTRY